MATVRKKISKKFYTKEKILMSENWKDITPPTDSFADLPVCTQLNDLEADIAHNRIAVSSPIARALIGKEEGDVGMVDAPGGVRELEILSVEYV